MVENSKIIIHQTLHGYREGHMLLASSIDLKVNEKRELQVLSDYSGSGVEKEFTEYLTGYSIPNSKYYAFAKTWYAPEMERPGCVWTHTFLIDVSVLWMIKNVDILLKKFRRPDKLKIVKYEEVLEFQETDFTINSEELSNTFYNISCLLYSNSKALSIVSNSSEIYAKDILAVWVYQWPRLKRNFSFSTGSMSSRNIGTKPFDLQVIPISREHMIAKGDREKLLIVNMENDKCNSDWLKHYKENRATEILEFMTKMGSDISPDKSNFVPLLRCFFLLNNPVKENTQNPIDLVKQHFPDSKEGKTIKSELIRTFWNHKHSNKFEILISLLTDKSFSEISWDYSKLITSAWENNELTGSQIIKILNKLTVKDYTLEILNILSIVPIKIWLNYPKLYKEVLLDLIPKINLIYANEEIWEAEENIQKIWINAFLNNKTTQYKKLVFSLLNANNGNYVDLIFNKLGDDIFPILFEWIFEKNQIVQKDWQFLIKNNITQSFEAASNLNNFNSALLSLFPTIISPTDGIWRSISSSTVKRFITTAKKSDFQIEKTGIYTFLLTSCFTNTLESSQEITKLIFQPLHDSLKNSLIDKTTWLRFKLIMSKDLYELVELDFFSSLFKQRLEIPDWDHCEFLRRALVSTFIKYGWEILLITDIITEPETFEKTVQFSSEIKPLKRLFKTLLNDMGKYNKTQLFHYKILNRYL